MIYMRRSWTEEEEEFMKRNYEIMNIEKISEILGRSKSSIKNKAFQIGLKQRPPHETWTVSDIKFLKENYRDMEFHDLMSRLNRTRSAIDTKAYELDLKRGWKWSEQEVDYLKANYKEMSYVDIGKKIGKSSSVVSSKAVSLNLRKPKLDLVGKKFNRLTVIEKIDIDNCTKWKCICECGTITHSSSSNLIRKNVTSCGCYHKEKTRLWMNENRHNFKVPKGKNHHWYNPLLTEEERLTVRRNFRRGDQEKFSLLVKERDDFTCQLCYIRGGKLNSHHLNSWNSFPEERFDVDNGITLCTECHNNFHDEYGRGNNTKEQFEEFKAKNRREVRIC